MDVAAVLCQAFPPYFSHLLSFRMAFRLSHECLCHSEERLGRLGLAPMDMSVEEQFYLFWPWLVLFIPKKTLLRAFVAVIAAAFLFRCSGVL